MIWLKDPLTKKESATLTFFAIGFIVAVIRFGLGKITGADFACVIGSLGAIYGFRRSIYSSKEDDKQC